VSRQSAQNVWLHGVVMGSYIGSRQIGHGEFVTDWRGSLWKNFLDCHHHCFSFPGLARIAFRIFATKQSPRIPAAIATATIDQDGITEPLVAGLRVSHVAVRKTRFGFALGDISDVFPTAEGAREQLAPHHRDPDTMSRVGPEQSVEFWKTKRVTSVGLVESGRRARVGDKAMAELTVLRDPEIR